METKLSIRTVGYYTYPIADSGDCEVCGAADYGDVIINGMCARCLRSACEILKDFYKAVDQADAKVKRSREFSALVEEALYVYQERLRNLRNGGEYHEVRKNRNL